VGRPKESALFSAGRPHGVALPHTPHHPDDNGLELYVDRPEAEWPRNPDGSLKMTTDWLDLEDLLKQ
jgi:catechol 2,3-dioxygenase